MNEQFRAAAAELDAGGRAPSPPARGTIDDRQLWSALGTVIDPEIGLDIVTLGLVYDVSCHDATVHVTFTLTTPGCPLEAVIRGGMEQALSVVPEVEAVELDLVWEPRWHPTMIREDAW